MSNLQAAQDAFEERACAIGECDHQGCHEGFFEEIDDDLERCPGCGDYEHLDSLSRYGHMDICSYCASQEAVKGDIIKAQKDALAKALKQMATKQKKAKKKPKKAVAKKRR